MASLLQRRGARIAAVVSSFDRIVVQGTLPHACYSEGLTALLRERGVKTWDYTSFVQPLNAAIRANAEQLARESDVEIEWVRSASTRKADLVAEVLQRRGSHPGLVHVLACMERCQTFKPRISEETRQSYLKPTTGLCVHYYFYFIDEALGLIYVRVPTWVPFRLQVYWNGHNELASKLAGKNIDFEMSDNSFVKLANTKGAQRLADDLDIPKLHARLDRYAAMCCPAAAELQEKYHWTIMQAEYSTDVIFKRPKDLDEFYESLVRALVFAVKADDIAGFLGRRLTSKFDGACGTDFDVRGEITRIRHYYGRASIKMYNKVGRVLRIETTVNDISFFRHYREVEQKNGNKRMKSAPLRKSIYSLDVLRQLMAASNQRYLEFASALEDSTAGVKSLQRVSKTTTRNNRRYRGLNFFSKDDHAVLASLAQGQFAINGLRNRDLRERLPDKKPAWVSRCLQRLRALGLLKAAAHTYRYHLTALGRRTLAAGLKLRELVITPMLGQPVR